MIGLELEVMAKKLDRFGWERDRGTPVHDRMVLDWMDALQDYPLDEVQEACRMHVKFKPGKMANEGSILEQLGKLRKAKADDFKRSLPAPKEDDFHKDRVSGLSAQMMTDEINQALKRMEAAE